MLRLLRIQSALLLSLRQILALDGSDDGDDEEESMARGDGHDAELAEGVDEILELP